MKRYFLVSLMALGIALGAAAQGSNTDYPAMVEFDKIQSAWFNSANAAGMTIDPLANYSDLSLGYTIGRGDFRLQPEGNPNILGINTSGATNLGRGYVWGAFTYKNYSANDTRFNTMTLNLEDDLPFVVADANVSPWKKQRYDLAMKVSTPLLGDVVALGMAASYFTESGAKQIDPRCTDYEYAVQVEPSLAFHFDGHTIGISGIYRNGNIREVPVNSNSQQDQPAWILRGLGNVTDAVVGSLSGINTFYYNRNKFGGSLQYGFAGNDLKFLAEGGYTYQMVDAFQSPTKPQRMGSTVQQAVNGKFQIIAENEDFFHKVTVAGFYRTTDGIEYMQSLSDIWYTLRNYIRSNYKAEQLSLGYDFFRKDEDAGYSWNAGAKAVLDDYNSVYLLPASNMDWRNVTGEVYAKKNFLVGDVAVLAGLRGAYRKNLSAEYKYGGAEPNSVIVTEFYQKDFAYNSADCVKAGATVNVAFPLSGRTAMYCQLDGDFAKPMNLDGNRIFATFTVGFTF